MKLSDYVINFIAQQGVKHVFMLPGGGSMHLVDSLGKCKEIEYICNLHEQACAIAAEAYARVTNNLGVALVTTGPGGTNAITGVAGAWLESTPCLVVSGQVKRADLKGSSGLRQRGPQELDIVSIVAPITKYAVTITDPSTIRYHLEKASYLAKSDRPGPTWLDIPLDVQAADIKPEVLEGFTVKSRDMPSETLKLSDQAAQAIKLLNEAARPVFLVGNGVRLSDAQKEILQLVNIIGIPVLTTWMGSDLLWDEHPLFFGKPGTVATRGANFTVQNADYLLSIGARLDFAVTGFDQTKFARAAKKVIVDVDEAEIRKLKMTIDVPVCADARTFIREILKQRETIRFRDCSNWLACCQEWKKKYPVVLQEYWEQSDYVNPYVFSSILADELTQDDLIIPGSSGAGIDTFWLSFKVKVGQRLFSTGGLGAMGFGIPASIGGCLASGRKRTISVEGDGGFQLNIQELETVARLNLPIKFFVLSNQGYESIRASQKSHFGRLVGADRTSGLTLPNIGNVAAAYGLMTARISDQTSLHQQIGEVLAMPGPAVCEVIVAPGQNISPRVTTAIRPDGSMISKPLEDLWPFLDRQEFLSNMIIPPLEE